MTIEFNGERFTNAAQFQKAYPAYRNYTDLVKAGAGTVMELEKAIRARQDEWKRTAATQARTNNQEFTFSEKRKKK